MEPLQFAKMCENSFTGIQYTQIERLSGEKRRHLLRY